jgi:hypothetical protein
MKKRGMRWKRANATAVAALWVQRFNDDWEFASARRRRVAWPPIFDRIYSDYAGDYGLVIDYPIC